MFQTKIRRVVVSTVLVSALSLLSVPNAGAEPGGRSNGKGSPASARVAIQSYSLLDFSLQDFLVSLWGKAGIRIDPLGLTKPQANDASVSTDSSAVTSPEEKR